MTHKTLLAILMLFSILNSPILAQGDDPCTATSILVEGSCNPQTFSNLGATPSSVGAPSCPGYAGGDVWFSFTMPSNGFHVVLEMSSSTISSAGMAVYSGSACGSLTEVSCDNTSGAGGFPRLKVEDGCNFANAGQTFYVRIWEDGNDLIGDFDLCAYVEEPDAPGGVAGCGVNAIAGNTCCDAILLSDLIENYCGNTDFYTPSPSNIPSFCANLDNNAWIAFVAADPIVSMDIQSYNCTFNSGLQVAILSTADCASFNVVSNCWNDSFEGTGTLSANSLTPGNIYYLMIDGYAGDECDYEITNVAGVQMTSISATDDVICTGGTSQLDVDATGAAPLTYAWSPAASLTDPTIRNPIANPSATTTYSVTVTDGLGVVQTRSVTVQVLPAAPSNVAVAGTLEFCGSTGSDTYTVTADDAQTYSWSVTGNATINGAIDQTQVNVDFTAGTSQVCVTVANPCGSSSPICETVIVNQQPDITAQTPPSSCSAAGFDLDNVIVNDANNTGGTRTYYAGASDATNDMNALASSIVFTDGVYWIRVTSGTNCFDITPVNIDIDEVDISVSPPPPTCAPASQDLNLVLVTESNSQPGTRTFFLDSLDAATDVNQMGSTTVSTAGTYWVRYELSSGCFDVAPIQIDIQNAPNVADFSVSVCGTGQVDLATAQYTDANNTTIVQELFYTNPGFANLGIPTLAMTNTLVSSGTYYMRTETSAGCFDVTTVTVTGGVPFDGQLIGGGTVCEGSTADLTFSFSTAGPFDVEYTDGTNTFNLSGINDGHMETITVNTNTTFTITSITGAGSCTGTIVGMAAIFNTNPNPEGSLTGGGNICQGETVDLTFNLTGTPPFDVAYSDGTNTFNLTGISDAHTEQVTINADVTYTITSVTDATGCIGTPSGSPISYTALPLPGGSVTGSGPLCLGEDAVLTINLTGNGPFNVTLLDTGGVPYPMIGINDGHVETIALGASTTFNEMLILDANGCSENITINNDFTIYNPIQISNVQANCSNVGLSTYTLSFEIGGGLPATYVVSGGGNLVGNIFTSDPIVSGMSYSFTVSDNSGCPTVSVDGSHDCTCLTDAGTMDGTPLSGCEGDSIEPIHNGDQVLDVGDIFGFVLHDGAGALLGNVFATGSTPEFTFQVGMTYGNTYYISSIAGPDDGSGEVDQNGTCFSISEGTPVVWHAEPSIVLSGDQTICDNEVATLTINTMSGTLPFTVVLSDGTQNQTVNVDGVNFQLDVSPTVNTTYSIVSVTDQTGVTCPGTGIGTATITVSSAPLLSVPMFICNGTNTEYQVQFTISGGDPTTYSFTGTAGTYDNLTQIFTSNPIPNGSPYSFGVLDANGCPTTTSNGVHVCNCTTNAGTMLQDTIVICGGGLISAVHNGDEILDADDAFGFVLHDFAGPNLGNVMLTGATPDFAYDNMITYGTVYYISSVVGNNDGSNFPVLNTNMDPCLSVSPGQPVIFYLVPTISIASDQTICEGDTTTLTLAIGGGVPVDVTYNQNGVAQFLTGVTDGYELILAPTTTTTIDLISVVATADGDCPGTIDPVANQVVVTVIDRPEVANFEVVCNDLGTEFSIQFDIVGGDPSTYSVIGDPGTLTGNTFVSEIYISGETYSFEVNDAGGCPPIILSNTEYCNCTPDIRPVISIVSEPLCAGDETGELMVEPLNGEAPYNFTWSTGTTGNQLFNLPTGWYYVTMVDGNNCPSIDSIFIQEPEILTAEVLVESVSCFGDTDGFIEIYNVTGGVGEYEYLFDTFPPLPGNSYSRLGARLYDVGVIDENGCIWQQTVEIQEPQDLQVELGNNRVVMLGDSINLVPNINRPVDTIMWYPTEYLACPGCESLNLKPEEEVLIQVVVEDASGCRAEDRIQILVDREVPIYIPNTFTPNGDGVNDRFTVFGNGGIQQINSLEIFTRWGEQVFRNTNFQPGDEALGWDGFMKSGEMMAGVYIYSLEVTYSDGTVEQFQGDLTLLR